MTKMAKLLGVTRATRNELIDVISKLAEAKHLCEVMLLRFPHLSPTFAPLEMRMRALSQMVGMELKKKHYNYMEKAYLHLLNKEIDEGIRFTRFALDLLLNKPWVRRAA